MLFKEEKQKEYKGHRQKIRNLKWSPDGSRLATASTDHAIRIWTIDLQTGQSKKSVEMRGHLNVVEYLCFHPKQFNILASCSSDKTVKIWDIDSYKCLTTIETPGSNINLCWHSDGSHLFVGNKSDLICVIETQNWTIQQEFQLQTEANEMTFFGNYLLITCGSGSFQLWSIQEESWKLFKDIKQHSANLFCIDVDPKRRFLAVGGADALVSLLELRDLITVRTFSNLDNRSCPVRGVGFSHDGKYIASASEDLFIDISEVETGQSVQQIKCSVATNTLSWHPKQHLLAYAGDEANRYGSEEGLFRIIGFS